ncbi:MAG: glycosyltransferase family 4 protein [Robiginitomaculum sp.]
MKVLQVVPALSAGGVERTTIEIAQALTNAGHSAHVASAGGRLEGELITAGGIFHELPMDSKNPAKLRSNSRTLIKLIKAEKIDIVHARSRAPAWAAHAAARACNVPFVTTYHGIYNAKSRLKRRYNAIMAKGDIIIANSQFTCEHIIKTHGVERARIVVIPRGVDMARFDPRAIKASDIKAQRAAWGAGAGETCLLLPGRLTGWKGQRVAIKALAKARQTLSAKLILLGDAQGRDDYVTELKVLAESLGVAEDVIIPGHSDNVPLALASADMVISASTDPEAFGRVAAEAQAMGKWVIASDHGGARETVIDGATGARTAVGDSDALAGAILSAPSFDKAKSRAHIAQNFSDSQMKAKTLAVYAKFV